jgi:salicylate hydroxylase
MKAIIAGGGIGGLNAALCFNKFGWEVEVLEQASELGEVGAGIQISPNGVKVLRALDVADAVGTDAFTPLSAQFRGGYSGRMIAKTRMGERMEDRYGAPYWHIHRADLIAALAHTVETRIPGAVRTGTTVIGYGQDESSAWAELSNGERVTGDIVIGADGIKSAIREQMLGAAKPRFTGNVAWRAVVPVSELGNHVPPPAACVWFGEGKHVVTYLLRRGTLANLVGVVERDDWTVESWTEQGTKNEAMRDFAGWHPTIRKIIDKAEAHYRWALFDRDPLDQWTEGRVALLGDSCHPMLPFMAQGAVMAIEDGYVLARELANHAEVETALSSYFSRRRDRTAKVQLGARRNMGVFHQRTLKGKLKTYAPLWLASRVSPDKFDERNDWLYGQDVTDNAGD